MHLVSNSSSWPNSSTQLSQNISVNGCLVRLILSIGFYDMSQVNLGWTRNVEVVSRGWLLNYFLVRGSEEMGYHVFFSVEIITNC